MQIVQYNNHLLSSFRRVKIVPPNDKTEKITPLSYDDFRYQPVNSDWRIIKSKEVLDNETDLPLLIISKIAIIQSPIRRNVL